MTTPVDIRQQLVDALAVVLPGRVQPYPPTTARYTTPSIFVDQLSLSTDGPYIVASFPVWVLSDGSERAQVAEHDDIVWNAYLALRPVADTVTVVPQQLAGFRASVITADFGIDVFTLCDPQPAGSAAIPPVLAGTE